MEVRSAAWQGSQTLLFTGIAVIGGLWLAHILTIRRAPEGINFTFALRFAHDPRESRQVPETEFLTKPVSLMVRTGRRWTNRLSPGRSAWLLASLIDRVSQDQE